MDKGSIDDSLAVVPIEGDRATHAVLEAPGGEGDRAAHGDLVAPGGGPLTPILGVEQGEGTTMEQGEANCLNETCGGGRTWWITIT